MKRLIILREGGRGIQGADKIPGAAKDRVSSHINKIITSRLSRDVFTKIDLAGSGKLKKEEYNDLDFAIIVPADRIDEFTEEFESRFFNKNVEGLIVQKVIFGKAKVPDYKVYVGSYSDPIEDKTYEVDFIILPTESMYTSLHTRSSAEEGKEHLARIILLRSIARFVRDPKYLDEDERFNFSDYRGLGKKKINSEREKSTIITTDVDKMLEILLGKEGKRRFKSKPHILTLLEIVSEMKEADKILDDFFHNKANYPRVKDSLPLNLQKRIEDYEN